MSVSRNLKKQTARAKEKLLESLGKADRTTDDLFAEQSSNFDKQQRAAERLQKEFKNYVACVKACANASKGFYEAVREVYEPEWPGVEHVKAITQSMELLQEDHQAKLNDRALSELNQYVSRFPEVRTRIQKRGKKLLDYDHARHTLEDAQSNTKKKDETKIAKAQQELTVATKVYEEINLELLDELPTLYDSRINFYITEFQDIFNSERVFHSEVGKLSSELTKQFDLLGAESSKFRTAPAVSQKRTSLGSALESKPSPKLASRDVPEHVPTTVVNPGTPKLADSHKGSAASKLSSKSVSAEKLDEKVSSIKQPESKQNGETAGLNPFDDESDESPPVSAKKAEDHNNDIQKGVLYEARREQAEHDTPPTTQPPPPPPLSKVLYKVRATHAYTKEDEDELSFEAGDIISVLPFEDPEEQDEGWLYGMKESSGDKGVFPGNFTKKME